MKLEFHPEAEQEFLAALSHYEAAVPGLGTRFDAELRSATALLLEYPEIGARLEDELRKLVLDRSLLPHLLALRRHGLRRRHRA
jgi:plasmid stabilization system protein ParE